MCLNSILDQSLYHLKNLSLNICFLILAAHHNITCWLLEETANARDVQ